MSLHSARPRRHAAERHVVAGTHAAARVCGEHDVAAASAAGTAAGARRAAQAARGQAGARRRRRPRTRDRHLGDRRVHRRAGADEAAARAVPRLDDGPLGRGRRQLDAVHAALLAEPHRRRRLREGTLQAAHVALGHRADRRLLAGCAACDVERESGARDEGAVAARRRAEAGAARRRDRGDARPAVEAVRTHCHGRRVGRHLDEELVAQRAVGDAERLEHPRVRLARHLLVLALVRLLAAESGRRRRDPLRDGARDRALVQDGVLQSGVRRRPRLACRRGADASHGRDAAVEARRVRRRTQRLVRLHAHDALQLGLAREQRLDLLLRLLLLELRRGDELELRVRGRHVGQRRVPGRQRVLLRLPQHAARRPRVRHLLGAVRVHERRGEREQARSVILRRPRHRPRRLLLLPRRRRAVNHVRRPHVAEAVAASAAAGATTGARVVDVAVVKLVDVVHVVVAQLAVVAVAADVDAAEDEDLAVQALLLRPRDRIRVALLDLHGRLDLRLRLDAREGRLAADRRGGCAACVGHTAAPAVQRRHRVRADGLQHRLQFR
mmetsp:Transcript_19228/g.67891  ORF Transcript_19228/g.67891 Transcript_19228/m.67891 type:complete len:555 (+) Transcript_19228:137-1801(+)